MLIYLSEIKINLNVYSRYYVLFPKIKEPFFISNSYLDGPYFNNIDIIFLEFVAVLQIGVKKISTIGFKNRLSNLGNGVCSCHRGMEDRQPVAQTQAAG